MAGMIDGIEYNISATTPTMRKQYSFNNRKGSNEEEYATTNKCQDLSFVNVAGFQMVMILYHAVPPCRTDLMITSAPRSGST